MEISFHQKLHYEKHRFCQMGNDSICTHDEKGCSLEKCIGQNEIEFYYDCKAVEVDNKHTQKFSKMSNQESFGIGVQREICCSKQVWVNDLSNNMLFQKHQPKNDEVVMNDSAV